MQANPEPAQDECKEPRLSAGAIAASLLSDWAGREPPFDKRHLSQLIHALGAGPVLSRRHRDQIAGLLHRLKDGHEPFERRRRSRGRPRKSVFNCQSVHAEHVAAEYVLALCLEGGWGAKPNALEKGMALADRLYPGHELTKRELDDAFRRYKAAGVVPRPSELLEKCALEERTLLGGGNTSIEAYWDNMQEEVDNDPEQRALRQRDHLHAMAIFSADTLATSLAPRLATALRTSFAKGLRSQFEADFAEALRPDLDEQLIESFFLRLSTLLPEAVSAVATLDVAKENPAR